jgi:hypothetical protein
MKITERKTAAKHDDFLTSVARSIGSTLGAVAAKVDQATRPARRRPTARKRVRKHGSVPRATRRRVSASAASKRSRTAARLTTSKRKKSSK